MRRNTKRLVKGFCEIARELELPLIRIYILFHLFKSLFLK